MSSSLVRRAVLGLCLVLAAAIAGPALAKGARSSVQVEMVDANKVVQARATGTFAAQCPRSRPHPVAPGFGPLKGNKADSLGLAASYPRGRRGWVVSVQNLSDQPVGYFAGFLCLGARARFAYPRSTSVVESYGHNDVVADCPRGAPHAIGGFFGVQSRADLGKVLLADTGIDKRAKGDDAGVGVKSFSGAPIGLYGGAVCTSLRTGQFGVVGNVAAGKEDGYTVRCPHRTQLAVGGAAFPRADRDRGAILVDALDKSARREEYVGVKSLADHPVAYSTGAVCVG